ncbi:hypothetical protein AV650_08395 [Serratia fonticola]|nr:hypothetical protein AV650_08395 [Serratia fonticola]
MLPVDYKKYVPPLAKPLRRILVVEPSRINWIGMQQLFDQMGRAEFSFCRVTELSEAKKKMYEFRPDVVLFSSLPRGMDYLLFLTFISDIYIHYPQAISVTRLRHDMAWFAPLLSAFGANSVFIDPVNLHEFSEWLTGNVLDSIDGKSNLLGKRERLTALAFLRGESATTIANISGKNARTISTQKKSLIRKLKMKTNEELYLLAGRLAYLSKNNS